VTTNLLSLANPAHVGHAVTHGASSGQIAGAVVGLAAAGVLAFFAWPVAAGAGVLAITLGALGAAGTVGYGIQAGLFVGKQVDAMRADSVAGHILTAFETVYLGPAVQHAARADEDTTADCAGEHVGWEGSKTVTLGMKPMSRVGDRLECQGKIMEGVETIHVGGDPSQEGNEMEEASDPTVRKFTLGSDVLGLIGAKGVISIGVSALGLVLDYYENPYGDDVGKGQLIHDTPENIKKIIELRRGG
jgi:uncharacterized Zn-binding protein involved in type VI secretion